MKTTQISVLMIGCGNMGASIAAAVSHRLGRASDIIAVDPNADRARQLLPADSSVRVVPGFDDLAAQDFDICIVAVKPQQVEAALRSARASIAGALVISIAAGVPLRRLRAAAPDLGRFVRVMPNLPALVSSAMSVGFADAAAITPDDRKAVEDIFAATGRFCWLESEDEVDLATGITGSGPGYVFAFTEQLQLAAEKMGFSRERAELFARQTVIGAARMLETDQRSAHDLKVAVTSPGGTTAAGLAVLEQPTALPHILSKTAEAAAERAAQLAKTQA